MATELIEMGNAMGRKKPKSAIFLGKNQGVPNGYFGTTFRRADGSTQRIAKLIRPSMGNVQPMDVSQFMTANELSGPEISAYVIAPSDCPSDTIPVRQFQPKRKYVTPSGATGFNEVWNTNCLSPQFAGEAYGLPLEPALYDGVYVERSRRSEKRGITKSGTSRSRKTGEKRTARKAERVIVEIPSTRAKPKARAKPKPKPKPKARAKPKPKPKPKARAKPKPKPQSPPKARAKPKPKPQSPPKARAKPKPKPKARTRPKAKRKPRTKQKSGKVVAKKRRSRSRSRRKPKAKLGFIRSRMGEIYKTDAFGSFMIGSLGGHFLSSFAGRASIRRGMPPSQGHLTISAASGLAFLFTNTRTRSPAFGNQNVDIVNWNNVALGAFIATLPKTVDIITGWIMNKWNAPMSMAMDTMGYPGFNPPPFTPYDRRFIGDPRAFDAGRDVLTSYSTGPQTVVAGVDQDRQIERLRTLREFGKRY